MHHAALHQPQHGRKKGLSMPLSAPVERELLHTRSIRIEGYQRSDGLYDIEARLTDTKTHGFTTDEARFVEAGENLHGMWMRLTIDEDMLIHAAEAVTDEGPYGMCPGGAVNFRLLAGLTIKPGFLRAANERVGGVAGCTHLRELLQQVGTVALQTTSPLRFRREAEARARAAAHPGHHMARPRLLNSCHAYDTNGDVVRRRWPEFYTGPNPGAAEGQDEAHDEAPNPKLRAEVPS
jgi:hypothetical protein